MPLFVAEGKSITTRRGVVAFDDDRSDITPRDLCADPENADLMRNAEESARVLLSKGVLIEAEECPWHAQRDAESARQAGTDADNDARSRAASRRKRDPAAQAQHAADEAQRVADEAAVIEEQRRTEAEDAQAAAAVVAEAAQIAANEAAAAATEEKRVADEAAEAAAAAEEKRVAAASDPLATASAAAGKSGKSRGAARRK